MKPEYDEAFDDVPKFEREHPELAAALREALAEGPRYSPAARRFLSGTMRLHDARRLGFVAGDDDENDR